MIRMSEDTQKDLHIGAKVAPEVREWALTDEADISGRDVPTPSGGYYGAQKQIVLTSLAVWYTLPQDLRVEAARQLKGWMYRPVPSELMHQFRTGTRLGRVAAAIDRLFAGVEGDEEADTLIRLLDCLAIAKSDALPALEALAVERQANARKSTKDTRSKARKSASRKRSKRHSA